MDIKSFILWYKDVANDDLSDLSAVVGLINDTLKSKGFKVKFDITCSEFPKDITTEVLPKLEFKNHERKSKNAELTPDPNAANIFQKYLGEFRERRRYNSFIPSEVTFADRKGPNRVPFLNVVKTLENWRCKSVGMSVNKFYRIASEFILNPSGVKYYPLKNIFCSDPESITRDIFYSRFVGVITWIADIVYHEEIEEVSRFMSELENRKISTKNVGYKSKDWYCCHAIKKFFPKKGWSEKDFLDKVKKYTSKRMKKTTPEMLLGDLVSGNLDYIDMTKKSSKVKGNSTVRLIKSESWYDEWKEEFREKLNETSLR